MKKVTQILLIFFLFSCQKYERREESIDSTAAVIYDNNQSTNEIKSDFTPIQIDTSINLNENRRYYRPSSLQDFWDDADDLRSNLESLKNDAEDLDCDDAISKINEAIDEIDNCEGTNNPEDAERYLDAAQSAYDDAKSAMEDCEQEKEDEESGENEDD